MEYVRSVLSERGTLPTLAACSVAQVMLYNSHILTILTMSTLLLRFVCFGSYIRSRNTSVFDTAFSCNSFFYYVIIRTGH